MPLVIGDPTNADLPELGDWVESDTEPASPETGDKWLDTSTDLLKRWDGTEWVTVGMNADGVRDAGRWEVILHVAESTIDRYVATANKTVENTVTETSLLGTGEGSLTFPADFFAAGNAVRITMRGVLSDTGTPDFTIRIKFGSTVIADVGPVALNGVSSVEWMLDALVTCRSAGASGTFVGGGLFDYDDGAELSLDSDADVSVDTTQELTLDVTWEWGAADVANVVTCREAAISLHNPGRIAVGGLEPVLPETEDDWVYGWVVD